MKNWACDDLIWRNQNPLLAARILMWFKWSVNMGIDSLLDYLNWGVCISPLPLYPCYGGGSLITAWSLLVCRALWHHMFPRIDSVGLFTGDHLHRCLLKTQRLIKHLFYLYVSRSHEYESVCTQYQDSEPKISRHASLYIHVSQKRIILNYLCLEIS